MGRVRTRMCLFSCRHRNNERHRRWSRLLSGALCVPLLSASVTAQSPSARSSIAPQVAPALTRDPEILARIRGSTGFFVDQTGSLVAARHAVENCGQLVIGKEQHQVPAQLVALAKQSDIALLRIPRTLGLAVVFPQKREAMSGEAVFAVAYDNRTDLQTSSLAGVARVESTQDKNEKGYFAIDSSATFGASGAPVLDRNGLVQGVISRRHGNHVLAVGIGEVKTFLLSEHVHIEEDDRPQVSAPERLAERAQSVSVHVTCLKN